MMENEKNENSRMVNIEISNKIESLIKKIAIDVSHSFIESVNLDDLRKTLKHFLRKNRNQQIKDVFDDAYLVILRKCLCLEEKQVRILVLKILRYSLEIKPSLANSLKTRLFPLVVCKYFEDFRYGTFEERFECFKFINSWLKFSESTFPPIFAQATLSILLVMKDKDDILKKGSIEFIRNLAVKKTEVCNNIGGFKILINALLDENCIDMSDNIFYTLLYLINSQEKRKYFTNIGEFYKIFSIFTKSDFASSGKEVKDNINSNNINNDEAFKLEIQLALSKRVIEKLLRTWPGYALLMGDFMGMSSIINSINTDTNIIIKHTVLDIIKELIENDYHTCDNFGSLISGDEFYVNKVYLAYILQGLHDNQLYNSLMKFIEKDNNNTRLSEYAQKIALKFIILYSKLSNIDLQLPLLNQRVSHYEFSQKIKKQNYYKETNELLQHKNIINKMISANDDPKASNMEEDVINTKIKIISMLDQTFYHFNCREISHMDVKDLSDVVVHAMNTVVNLQTVKKYNNQYSKEVSKKELYLIDDATFQLILKNSHILDSKDFIDWDWERIDQILDILEYRREFIHDLFKQRFFKRLLNFYMPSKNLFISQKWNQENFHYASVGTKFFRILSSSVEGIKILDTSPEENYFAANKTWYEDVFLCLETLFNTVSKSAKNYKDNGPFSLRGVAKSMARQTFTFLGIISQSTLGEDYLDKKHFYNLIRKGLVHSGKFDYILTILIDNLNFNTKNAVELIQDILEYGSKRIKRYIFEHIRCLFKFGKEVLWSFKNFKFSIDHDSEVAKIVVNILSSLFTEGKYIDDFLSAKPLIKKISIIQKEILYIMMRNNEAYENLTDFIEEEIKNLNIVEIIENYSKELEQNMSEIFNMDETPSDHYYMNINLPKIENQYENFSELFWIKQLPFNINIGIEETEQFSMESLVFNTYLEFHDSHKLILYSSVHDEIKINFEKHSIKFACVLGDQIINNNCRKIYHANLLTFDINDFRSMTTFYKNDNREEQYFRIEKDGVVINFTKDPSDPKEVYTLYSLYLYLRINPAKKESLRTPINFLTELANTEDGTNRLIENDCIQLLLDYLRKNETSIKHKKAILWILAKICIKENQGLRLNQLYGILKKIIEFYHICGDYAMKGTICYVLCYISSNKELKAEIESLGWNYFFNTSICYPKNMKEIYFEQSEKYEFKKFYDDFNKVNRHISLNEKSTEIFNLIANTMNGITNKQATDKLFEIYKSDVKAFADPNLVLKVYALLSTYKYRQNNRRLILNLFEKSITSQEVLDYTQKIFKNLGDDLL